MSNGKTFETSLENDWNTNSRWKGIKRPYTASDVEKISGTVQIEYTLAKLGAQRLWKLLQSEPYIAALGALTGNQVRIDFKNDFSRSSGSSTSPSWTSRYLCFRLASCRR